MTKRRITIADIYNRSECKDKVSSKVFKEVWDLFATFLSKELIHTGKAYKLPFHLGTLQIRKDKSRRKTIDFHKTKQYGQTIYNTNNHSEGYYAFLYWDTHRPHCQMEFKSIYKIEFTRDNKRYLARQIKENNSITKYYEI